MRYVLDSTVLIDYLRGRPAVGRVAPRCAHQVRWRRRPRSTSRRSCEAYAPRNRDAARRLFDGLTVLPNDAGTARRAGIWRRDHATRGITLYPADNLITAASHANRAAPVTANPKDFPMDEVVVQHWPVGR